MLSLIRIGKQCARPAFSNRHGNKHDYGTDMQKKRGYMIHACFIKYEDN